MSLVCLGLLLMLLAMAAPQPLPVPMSLLGLPSPSPGGLTSVLNTTVGHSLTNNLLWPGLRKSGDTN